MPMSLRMRRCEKEPHPALSNRDGSEVSSLKVLFPTGEEDLGGRVNKLAANRLTVS